MVVVLVVWTCFWMAEMVLEFLMLSKGRRLHLEECEVFESHGCYCCRSW